MSHPQSGVKIYFTRDGSIPVPGQSKLYRGSVGNSYSFMVQAVAYHPDYMTSEMASETVIMKKSSSKKIIRKDPWQVTLQKCYFRQDGYLAFLLEVKNMDRKQHSYYVNARYNRLQIAEKEYTQGFIMQGTARVGSFGRSFEPGQSKPLLLVFAVPENAQTIDSLIYNRGWGFFQNIDVTKAR